MKARIICLEENEHSREMAKDCYDQAVLHGLSPSYFKAINGNDAALHYQRTGVRLRRKMKKGRLGVVGCFFSCLLYTSPSPRDLSTSRMPSSA